jgi:hypothetical protein
MGLPHKFECNNKIARIMEFELKYQDYINVINQPNLLKKKYRSFKNILNVKRIKMFKIYGDD